MPAMPTFAKVSTTSLRNNLNDTGKSRKELTCKSSVRVVDVDVLCIFSSEDFQTTSPPGFE